MGLAERPARCYLYSQVVPQRREKGGSSEQISKVITHDMALPVSHHLGSEVPVPDSGRAGGSESCGWDPGNLWLRWFRIGGTECSKRSCASDRDGAAKALHFGSHGACKRSNVHEDLQAVPISQKKALLGQSFLGKGLLCRHRRNRRRNDPQVRKASREERTPDRTTPTGYLRRTLRRNPACPLRGQALVPPMGDSFKAGSFGPGFFTEITMKLD
jgi:hypothetical protein